MASHRVVFLDRETLAPQIRVRRPWFDHVWIEHGLTSPAQVTERLRGASIAITNKVPIGAEDLVHLPELKLVAVAATGTDCVDRAACAAHGVAVCNIRGYAVTSVPEHTFALMLALQRSLVAYRQSVLAGRWQEVGRFCFFDHPVRDLAGSRLGIVGRGSLGQRVAELARAFGMEPVFAGRKTQRVVDVPYLPWDEVLATSDILTLHCPLTPETRGLIGRDEFRAMQRRPLLINTSRGGLVDEAALVQALDEGLISGAGFDVADGEPPSLDNPLYRIADRPNVLLTPHVAWASDQAQQTLADQLIDNIEAFVAGRPTHTVG